MNKILRKFYSLVERIGKRNVILIVFIILVIIITGLYQTFSLYTESNGVSIIDGLKTYKFILGENQESSVSIAGGSSKNVAITVSNHDKIKLRYSIYYTSSDELTNVELGYSSSSEYPASGLIEAGQDYIVTIKIYNNSNQDITLNFGLQYGLENGGELIVESNQHSLDIIYPYQHQVEYLESTGTQYIDTLFYPNQDTSIEMVAIPTQENSILAWFGGRKTYRSNSFVLWQLADGTFRSDYASNEATVSSYVNGTKYTIYKNKNVTMIDGQKYAEAEYINFASPSTLTLFGVKTYEITNDNLKDNVDSRMSSLKLYSCKIWDNETLVRDYIPVIDRKGIPCLYDKVNDELYYLLEIIYPYQYQVEYLESTGTQYIDTLIYPNQDTSIEMVATTTQANSTLAWFGGRKTYLQESFVLWQLADGTLRSDYASTQSTVSSYVNGTKYTIYKNKNVTMLDGQKYAEAEYINFTSPSTLTLFGVKSYEITNDNLKDGVEPRMSSLKLYSCKIWDNETLVRDYIPVIDRKGIPCLYDKVNDKFYYNQGESGGGFLTNMT